ncbi:FAD binding domain-containing protein [Mesorhizobium sp. CO1-1-8]|uniref:FAD binding domain-containing protein n=1 Tax=Mesorhizobium sp. CO1-1-8 TaxID=2876631 RepID=UPI001CD15E02|nr:FAD binding domain-containing protein [Mesorhizobium sp. CO1-1-8]MBZ9772417.1 FAD binding domain-containing protein [Mesorhizobium sp. CO1-1-8]
MKPAPFEYERPDTLKKASLLASEADRTVKIVAGSQSLGPMLNMRLTRPDRLVDITAIPELRQVSQTPGALTLGACITHADIEDGRVPDTTNGLLRFVASRIAYRAVRNRGTIGGSLCHADPAADWLSALGLLGTTVHVASSDARQTIPIEEFTTGPFGTKLLTGDLLETVEIPSLSRSARWGYYKFCRKPGEFAHAVAGVLRDEDRQVFRAVIGGSKAPPIYVADANSLIDDRNGWSVKKTAVVDLLAAHGVSEPYDLQLHVLALERAVARS